MTSGYMSDQGPQPYQTPCPYCGEVCEADFVDIGVGFQQCGPFHCESCGASQIGPEGKEGCTDEEKKTGWYKGDMVSPYATTVKGVLVDHQTARAAYEMGMLDHIPSQPAYDPEPDWEYDESECPKCGHYPTRWQRCTSIRCEDGYVDLYEEDPLWYDQDDCEVCEECCGFGVVRWCPECGHDLNSDKLLTEEEEG